MGPSWQQVQLQPPCWLDGVDEYSTSSTTSLLLLRSLRHRREATLCVTAFETLLWTQTVEAVEASTEKSRPMRWLKTTRMQKMPTRAAEMKRESRGAWRLWKRRMNAAVHSVELTKDNFEDD